MMVGRGDWPCKLQCFNGTLVAVLLLVLESAVSPAGSCSFVANADLRCRIARNPAFLDRKQLTLELLV
jgi:hypothetical protein